MADDSVPATPELTDKQKAWNAEKAANRRIKSRQRRLAHDPVLQAVARALYELRLGGGA